jgi:hypothetical protein
MNKPIVPIWEKIALTIPEAAALSNIGLNKISQLLSDPRCNFVLHIGNKKLVKRKEFIKFLENNIEI